MSTQREHQSIWKDLILGHVDATSEHHARISASNGENQEKPPEMPLIADEVVQSFFDALQKNNTPSPPEDRRAFQEQWPMAASPLIDALKDEEQFITAASFLPDGSVLAQIQSHYTSYRLVRVFDTRVEEVTGWTHFGRSTDRKHFARHQSGIIEVTEGWDGPVICSFDISKGVVPKTPKQKIKDYFFEASEEPGIHQMIPFSRGEKVLLVRDDGFFVLSQKGHIKLSCPNIEGEPQDFFAMAHGTVSADSKFIAIGHQDSKHLIFNEELSLVASIGQASSYPHLALFNADSSQVILNSCHFYNGNTLAVEVQDFDELDTEPFEDEHPLAPMTESGDRLYAGVADGKNYLLGNAFGTVFSLREDGTLGGSTYVGGSVTALDISEDNQWIVAGTALGFLSFLRANQAPSRWQIKGTAHQEDRRWIFREHKKAMLW